MRARHVVSKWKVVFAFLRIFYLHVVAGVGQHPGWPGWVKVLHARGGPKSRLPGLDACTRICTVCTLWTPVHVSVLAWHVGAEAAGNIVRQLDVVRPAPDWVQTGCYGVQIGYYGVQIGYYWIYCELSITEYKLDTMTTNCVFWSTNWVLWSQNRLLWSSNKILLSTNRVWWSTSTVLLSPYWVLYCFGVYHWNVFAAFVQTFRGRIYIAIGGD